MQSQPLSTKGVTIAEYQEAFQNDKERIWNTVYNKCFGKYESEILDFLFKQDSSTWYLASQIGDVSKIIKPLKRLKEKGFIEEKNCSNRPGKPVLKYRLTGIYREERERNEKQNELNRKTLEKFRKRLEEL